MKKMDLFKIGGLLYCLILCIFIFTQTVVAQTIPDGTSIPGLITDIKEQISADVYPQIPKPYDEVTITVEGYGTDLNRSDIVWTVNGKVALRGQGQKKFTFKVGGVGSSNNISLNITPVSGPDIQKSFSFTPAEVDILWEADTYTPPFYKGKALFTPEADVTFVAIPNMISKGVAVSSNNAVINWRVDRKADASKSGLGKNTFKYTGSIILKPHLVQAEIYSSTDPKNKALGGVTLEDVDPKAIVYESHPLNGVLFNNAITGNYYLNQSEVQMAVFPYYFSTPNKNSYVTYKWNLNQLPIQAADYETQMTFRKTDQQIGDASISLILNSASKVLQEARAGFSIVFGK